MSVTSATCCFCESVYDHVSKVMQSHVLAWTISHIENFVFDGRSWQRANIWPIYLVSIGSTQVRVWTLLCSESINVLCVHKLIYYGGTAHWASWPDYILSVSWPLSNTHHVLHAVTYNQHILIISSACRACSFTRSVQIQIMLSCRSAKKISLYNFISPTGSFVYSSNGWLCSTDLVVGKKIRWEGK